MRTKLILLLVLLAEVSLAQEQAIPTRRILPADVIPESITLVQLSTNSFIVRWNYTEAGARRMLAFNEAHEGEQTRTVVGDFEFLASGRFQPMPPVFTNYAQWKKGWLRHRSDKFIGVNEADAKRILAGLKGK